jgi:Right handed beta helix region
MILDLTGASNVEVACLEITDHAGCVEFHPGLPCERDTYPFGDWASAGLYAQDSANVHLKDLDVHGLAHTGIWAGRLTDWTVENVRVAANGWVGWDGDIGASSSNSSTLTFRHWTVEWNGCGETWPGLQPTGCWGQEAGGYGDGVGTATTGGNWVIEDSAFLHNTQDGLDLLYARLLTSTIEIRRTIAEGNAGNQIKVTGPTLIENSIVVGNCGFFDGFAGWNSGDDCRAGGDALVIDLRPGNVATVTNSTLTGEGVCLAIASCALNQTCNGSETIRMRNNIFQGQPRFSLPSEDTCFAWYDDEPPDDILPQNPFTTAFSLITGARFGNVTPCPGPHNLCDVSPGLVNATIDAFDARLLPTSPAIDTGDDTVCPATDYGGTARPQGMACDIGAYERWVPSDWIYLPLVLKKP